MVRKYKEPTVEELMARKNIQQKLLNKHPLEWSFREMKEWLDAGLKLPKIIKEKYDFEKSNQK